MMPSNCITYNTQLETALSFRLKPTPNTYFIPHHLQGETHTSIVLNVRNDSTPETYEVFVVRLSNIQTFGIASPGHASFIQGKTTATVSIGGSDRPHGVIELEAGSRLVSRNDEKNFTLTVTRLFGDIGKCAYRQIPIMSSGLILHRKTSLVGLFSGELGNNSRLKHKDNSLKTS